MHLRHSTYQKLYVGAGDGGRLSVINLALVVIILAAVAVAIIGTEPYVMEHYRTLVYRIEIGFGVIFLIEYLVRLWCVAEKPGDDPAWKKRLKFVFSPLAIIDLIVIVTSLLPYFLADAAVLRLVRLLRLLALAKFTRLTHAVEEISAAVWTRRYELVVTIALAWVLLLVGATALHWAEGAINPKEFGSVPRALWWAIITLTTVGYGDVSPVTPLGKVLGSMVALCGVALVAMPAGIMAAAFSDSMQHKRKHQRKLRKMEREIAKAKKEAKEAGEEAHEARSIASEAEREARRDP